MFFGVFERYFYALSIYGNGSSLCCDSPLDILADKFEMLEIFIISKPHRDSDGTFQELLEDPMTICHDPKFLRSTHLEFSSCSSSLS